MSQMGDGLIYTKERTSKHESQKVKQTYLLSLSKPGSTHREEMCKFALLSQAEHMPPL